MAKKRKILITSALPYANGDIHLGHMVEHMITDFWARYQKLRGNECLAFCADDTHGAAIMIEARKKNVDPIHHIEETRKRHLKDFADFEIHYDHYSSTNSKANEEFCHKFYQALKDSQKITCKTMEQCYCPHDKMFLPDRFVKGTCPKCKTENQYGDNCDACGAVYDPTELINPSCALCGNKPIKKDSKHYFVDLKSYQEFLEAWVPKHVAPPVAKKLEEWFDSGLKDWCLTRDKPYFGFALPDDPEKFYYVWFDAPIGYLSTTHEWCEKNNRKVEEFWKDENAEIYHNIGKDIVYFHSLFWPAMLKTAGWKTPNYIFVHGMLTINGEKLSKSKGTFINASTYINHADPSYLRYYYACKLSNGIADLDLNLDDFITRVNSDLIGKVTNIASRGFQMLQKNFDGKLGSLGDDGKKLLAIARSKASIIENYYETRQFSKAIVEIRNIADLANKYFDDHSPWKLIKEDKEKTKEILTTILNLFRLICIYLKPVLPSYVKKVENLFGEKPYLWSDIESDIENIKTEKFSHLLTRLEKKKVMNIIEDSKEEQKKQEKKAVLNTETDQSKEITINDFSKVDLRVAKVIKAEQVEGADKLLKVLLDVGELGERTVFAGIKEAYAPEQLEGKFVALVANLKPRKMKFGVSEGMIMASGPGGKDVHLVSFDSGVKAGMKIN
ncbi:MAG: methionine--tRNA ligase [Zetaproteobacteria bacterium]|nr:methionine--tRNA ligase [Pseudobdellovibrionaceae bacterium]